MEIVAHSTAGVAPAQRAAAWSGVIAETYFPLTLTFRQPQAFAGRLERRRIGNVSLSRLETEPLHYERQARHIGSNREEEYLITVPRRSPVEFSQLGRSVRCDPGGFILERGDAPYRFCYPAANELSVLKVSRRALSEKLRSPDRFCAQVIEARAGLGALFATMMHQLQILPATESHAANLLGRQIVELLAVALDQRIDREDGVRTSVRAAHLKRAEQVIRANLADPALSPEFVADACRISKRYLHELFGDTEQTVSQFIRHERLIAARDEIAAARQIALAEIAYRYGFSDQAQFSRQFKAAFGVTPTEWRRNPTPPGA